MNVINFPVSKSFFSIYSYLYGSMVSRVRELGLANIGLDNPVLFYTEFKPEYYKYSISSNIRLKLKKISLGITQDVIYWDELYL